jgi:6-phosphogluconolactonase
MMCLPPLVTLNAFDDYKALLAKASYQVAVQLDTAHAVALTGGNTAKALYFALAAEPEMRKAKWRNIDWFWGDDRFVTPDHPDSNIGMARRAMLDGMGAARCHAIPSDAHDAYDAAQIYESTLQSFYGFCDFKPEKLLFDLVLLSLGPDGHIASLLPESAVLKEQSRWTGSVQARDHARVTLTYRALESARMVIMLASGASKREALAGWFLGDDSLPVTRLKPNCGICLFADIAALGPHFKAR